MPSTARHPDPYTPADTGNQSFCHFLVASSRDSQKDMRGRPSPRSHSDTCLPHTSHMLTTRCHP
eukprot:3603236-Rhodomonas_salina.1